MRNCTKSDYRKSEISDQIINRVNINSYACPKNRTYMVRGDSLDEQYTYLSVKIKRCNPRITPGMCKSE